MTSRGKFCGGEAKFWGAVALPGTPLALPLVLRVFANAMLWWSPQNLFLFADSAVKFFITNLASIEKVGLEKVGLTKQQMSTDKTVSDWIRTESNFGQIRTESNFGQIRTGSECNLYENWRIRTGLDWQIFSCIFVIILNTSKSLVVIRFYRFSQSMGVYFAINGKRSAETILQFELNCIHLCEHITLSSAVTAFFSLDLGFFLFYLRFCFFLLKICFFWLWSN